MSKINRPFRINVGFIIGGQIGIVRDFDFAYPHIALSPYLEVSNLKGVATISRNPQGLLVEARFEADTELTCSRCLEPFMAHINWDFIDNYVFPQKRKQEEDLIVPMDGYLDLQEQVHDYASLAIPLRPICKPDCRGLCPVCGENRNLTNCEHPIEETPPDDGPSQSPFSVLKDLLQ